MEVILKSGNLDWDDLEKLSDRILTLLEGILKEKRERIDMNRYSARYISPSLLRQLYRKLVKLRELLSQMTKSKNVYCFEKAAIIERLAIHFLLERCYWIQYNDSQMVSDLLKMLFEVDGHLGKIFNFQQLSVSSRKSKANTFVFETTWSEGTLSSEQIQPFAYFLEQTNKAKALFTGQRLAEKCFVQSISCSRLYNNPLTLPPSSVTFKFPEILIKLLQYGLFANSEPDESDLGKLLTGIIGVILNFSQKSCSRHVDYTKRIIKAGNVLLRAVPRVNMSELLKSQRLTVREKENKTISIVQELSVPTLLPLLKYRCTGLQDLKHLCRITLRRVLYDNWKLPQGITLLPLPIQIKGYLNLQYD